MALRALRGTGPSSPGASKVASPLAARRHQKGGSTKERGAGALGGRIAEPAPPRPAPRSSPTPACAPRLTLEAPARPKTPRGRSIALSKPRARSLSPPLPARSQAPQTLQMLPLLSTNRFLHVSARSTSNEGRNTCADFVGQVVQNLIPEAALVWAVCALVCLGKGRPRNRHVLYQGTASASPPRTIHTHISRRPPP